MARNGSPKEHNQNHYRLLIRLAYARQQDHLLIFGQLRRFLRILPLALIFQHQDQRPQQHNCSHFDICPSLLGQIICLLLADITASYINPQHDIMAFVKSLLAWEYRVYGMVERETRMKENMIDMKV